MELRALASCIQGVDSWPSASATLALGCCFKGKPTVNDSSAMGNWTGPNDPPCLADGLGLFGGLLLCSGWCPNDPGGLRSVVCLGPALSKGLRTTYLDVGGCWSLRLRLGLGKGLFGVNLDAGDCWDLWLGLGLGLALEQSLWPALGLAPSPDHWLHRRLCPGLPLRGLHCRLCPGLAQKL